MIIKLEFGLKWKMHMYDEFEDVEHFMIRFDQFEKQVAKLRRPDETD